MDRISFLKLIDKYQDGTASRPEKALLEEYYRRMGAKDANELTDDEGSKIKERMYRQITAAIDFNDAEPVKGKTVYMWRKIAVAASVILLVSFGVYFFYFNKGGKQPIETVISNAAADVKAPVASRATITLANGQVVYLDSASKGTLAVQGSVDVVKGADGQIVYTGALRQAQGDMQYNTLTNPRGSKVVDMTLSDGTRVWLNAGSSVTYPVAFVGKERKVTIDGEGYFEVTHNAAMPFKVNKGNMEVTVLGTHFNVNAYDDDAAIKVTLLEGSVHVVNGEWSMVNGKQKLAGHELIIKPGEQAVLRQAQDDPSAGSGQAISITKDIDLDAVMAWKNGRFQFEGVGIDEVMKQVGRWYDVEVVYEARPKEQHFRGGIARDVEASKLFTMLEATGAVHFRIEGRKVFVLK